MLPRKNKALDSFKPTVTAGLGLGIAYVAILLCLTIEWTSAVSLRTDG